MTLETLIGGMTREEKLAALDIIWEQLAAEPSSFVSPAWHEQVLQERLQWPDPAPRISLAEARKQVEESIHASRTTSRSP